MRLFALMLLFDCCTVLAADPPRFEVRNRCTPQFVVVNKTAAAPCVCGPDCACSAAVTCGCGHVRANPAPPLYVVPAHFGGTVYGPPVHYPFGSPGFDGTGGCAGGSCGAPPSRGFFRR